MVEIEDGAFERFYSISVSDAINAGVTTYTATFNDLFTQRHAKTAFGRDLEAGLPPTVDLITEKGAKDIIDFIDNEFTALRAAVMFLAERLDRANARLR